MNNKAITVCTIKNLINVGVNIDETNPYPHLMMYGFYLKKYFYHSMKFMKVLIHDFFP